MLILIVEDEPLAARRMHRLLQEAGYGEARLIFTESIDETVQWLNSNPPPDLIFQDIELADGSCFSIYERVTVSSPVIFTTAYHEHALRAFELNSIDYLLKPIEPENLHRALEKHRRFSGQSAQLAIQSLIEQLQPNTFRRRLLVNKGDELISLACEELAWFRAEDKMVQLCTLDNKRFWLSQSLDELQRELDPTQFFRCSRSLLVQREAIGKVALHFQGKLKLELNPPLDQQSAATVSRERAVQFKLWLGS